MNCSCERFSEKSRIKRYKPSSSIGCDLMSTVRNGEVAQHQKSCYIRLRQLEFQPPILNSIRTLPERFSYSATQTIKKTQSRKYGHKNWRLNNLRPYKLRRSVFRLGMYFTAKSTASRGFLSYCRRRTRRLRWASQYR